MSAPGPLVRLVDDDADLLAATAQALKIAGFTVQPFGSAAEALQGLDRDYPGVVLTDVRMPQIDGLELFNRLKALDPELPVILLTGHGDVEMAVAALKAGAYDFLTKPAGADQLAAALRRASAQRALVMENRQLRQLPRASSERETLLGDSAVIEHLRETVARVAETGVDALITGEGGAGKETVARAIHRQSPRRARAFVHVACAALDPDRFELEFIGAEPGQPGAPRHQRLVGRLEKAHRGTLFLAEVDALPLPLQARLQAVIEAGEISAPGSATARELDLRVLASTRRDLQGLVRQGQFRADLYYRLSGVILQVPPLSARREDIPLLFRHFVQDASARLNLPVPVLTALTLARLQAHDWPGNLRELRQFAEGTVSGVSAFGGAGPAEARPGLADMLATYESEIIREALRMAGGNASRAMDDLKLPRKTFYDKLARHGIKASDFRG
ncbi:sigma-54-dependent Fis family transcriptional regulator [Paracoccus caeni]|uniref:Sigma-54-dependent Fis family transcriptional regulator n=1 Tax=Paracoccus caeni TaxID=657651 RepID=A0A934W0Q2_9RHOB|nr:sigma-54 dependent transcriptional regulator [Paracoccus caeni]MBK4217185.1 sigma-54-dependent Fis family transcriptional regulator [Paracoccus caeni]